jgi:hypothetical protein
MVLEAEPPQAVRDRHRTRARASAKNFFMVSFSFVFDFL